MRKAKIFLTAMVLVVAAGGVPVWADGDAESGEKVFRKCKTCHTFDPAQKKIGPHLQGIFGRKAGTVAGFKYSKPMAESGIVWDEAKLDEYLLKPKDFIPGNKMTFAGLKKPEGRADVIAYINAQSK